MKITKSPNKFLIQTKPIFALDLLMCEQDFGRPPWHSLCHNRAKHKMEAIYF